MKKDKGLQSRQIPLYAGVRSEVDRKFLKIINSLPKKTNLNEFIKSAVVEVYWDSNDPIMPRERFVIEADIQTQIDSAIPVLKTDENDQEVITKKIDSLRSAFDW